MPNCIDCCRYHGWIKLQSDCNRTNHLSDKYRSRHHTYINDSLAMNTITYPIVDSIYSFKDKDLTRRRLGAVNNHSDLIRICIPSRSLIKIWFLLSSSCCCFFCFSEAAIWWRYPPPERKETPIDLHFSVPVMSSPTFSWKNLIDLSRIWVN